MFDELRLGLNDEELDDYRDYDDEHSERGSKLDDVGVDEDDETEEVIVIIEAPIAAPGESPVPVAAESKSEAASTAKKAAPAKKAPAKKVAAKKRTPNAAFMKPMTPSASLAAIIGDKAIPRTEVTKKVWEYIKKHNLQDAAKRTMINADAKLKEIFKKAQVSMFEMTKLVSKHLK